MKKMLFYMALLGATVAQAEMHFDVRSNKFSTYPAFTGAKSDFNSLIYNKLAWEFYKDLSELYAMEKYSDAYIWRLACINAKNKAKQWTNYKRSTKRFIHDLELIPDIQAFRAIIGLA